jgi:hypothetical protein
MYRAADARANVRAYDRVDYGNGYRHSAQQGGYPPYDALPGSPATTSRLQGSFAPRSCAEAGDRASEHPTTACSPSRHPRTTYPPAGELPHNSRNDPAYAPTRSPACSPMDSTPDSPTGSPGYPATGSSTTIDTRDGYRARETSWETTPPPRYEAGGYAPRLDPGIARFQGRIEKPTGTDVDEYNRQSIH